MFSPQFLVLAVVVIIVVTNLPGLLDTKDFQKALKSFVSNDAAVRASSGSFFIVALLFLSIQWQFTYDWNVVIPILGWLSFIKGLIFLWAPGFVKKETIALRINTAEHTKALSVMAILFAIALSYIAIYYLPA